jgi:hypothetical protein
MWEEINSLVKENDCKLSLYIDDVTISGHLVPGKLIWAIKKIFYRFEHSYKVNKERCTIEKPIEVTGAIVKENKLLLPNRRHKKMHNLRRDIANALAPEMEASLKRKLRGCEAQMKQVVGFFEESL